MHGLKKCQMLGGSHHKGVTPQRSQDYPEHTHSRGSTLQGKHTLNPLVNVYQQKNDGNIITKHCNHNNKQRQNSSSEALLLSPPAVCSKNTVIPNFFLLVGKSPSFQTVITKVLLLGILKEDQPHTCKLVKNKDT